MDVENNNNNLTDTEGTENSNNEKSKSEGDIEESTLKSSSRNTSLIFENSGLSVVSADQQLVISQFNFSEYQEAFFLLLDGIPSRKQIRENRQQCGRRMGFLNCITAIKPNLKIRRVISIDLEMRHDCEKIN